MFSPLVVVVVIAMVVVVIAIVVFVIAVVVIVIAIVVAVVVCDLGSAFLYSFRKFVI